MDWFKEVFDSIYCFLFGHDYVHYHMISSNHSFHDREITLSMLCKRCNDYQEIVFKDRNDIYPTDDRGDRHKIN